MSYPRFTFVEFNPRRVARGAEGARVKVEYSQSPDDYELLWMSRGDVSANLKTYPDDAELMKARAAYGK